MERKERNGRCAQLFFVTLGIGLVLTLAYNSGVVTDGGMVSIRAYPQHARNISHEDRRSSDQAPDRSSHNITMDDNVTSYLQLKPGKIYVETQGRLGNIIFQYAALYGLVAATGRDGVVYSETDVKSIFPNITLNIVRASHATKTQFYKLPVAKETDSGIFTPTLASKLVRGDVRICCFLQSFKYFWHVKDHLLQELQFSDSIQTQARTTLYKISGQAFKNVPTRELTYIGIHVRRGDLVAGQHHNEGYQLPDVPYFDKARAYFRSRYKNTIFVVASDDKPWVSKNLQTNDTYISGARSATVDLAILTACNHTITTVGTFSWWAGFLAGGENIYYESFRRKGSKIYNRFNMEDRFPTPWIPMTD